MRTLLSRACLLGALFATPVFAQVQVDVNAPPAPSITVQPHWQWDAQDRVYVTTDPNVDYDMFRSGQWFYVYNDGYWYRASEWSGPYLSINRTQVPRTFFYMSDTQYQWHGSRPTLAYNPNDNDNRYGNDNNAYNSNRDRGYRVAPMVTIQPRWRWVPEQHVYVAANPDRNYEMFRSGDWYYVNQDGTWYRASRWSGPYAYVQDNTVPYEVVTVSRSGPYQNRYYDNNGYQNRYVQAPVIRHRPHWRWMPDQRVYVATNSDYDMYRVGSWYYVNDNGTWFRGQRWDGSWEMIRTDMVPQPVFSVTGYYNNGRHRGHHRRDWDRERD
jgi:hypothetical protein